MNLLSINNLCWMHWSDAWIRSFQLSLWKSSIYLMNIVMWNIWFWYVCILYIEFIWSSVSDELFKRIGGKLLKVKILQVSVKDCTESLKSASPLSVYELAIFRSLLDKICSNNKKEISLDDAKSACDFCSVSFFIYYFLQKLFLEKNYKNYEKY